jgi:hypothetical protein
MKYGFNGQEKCPEIAEGHTTALFWEYDSRLGRRWNLDPKPNPSISQYATFENNPIKFSDVLGDTVKGNNIVSANRLVSVIQSSFNSKESKAFKKLIKLQNVKGVGGLALTKINQSDYDDAVKNMSEDEKSLASGYFQAINSTDMHTVELITREETSSYSMPGMSGSAIDDLTGGGFNQTDGTGQIRASNTLIIMNSKCVTRKEGAISMVVVPEQPNVLVAHELLGHGLSTMNGIYSVNNDLNAVRMSNLALRVHRSQQYRSGSDHGTLKYHSKSELMGVPSYLYQPKLQIPTTPLNIPYPYKYHWSSGKVGG